MEEGCCSLNARGPTQIVQDLNPTQNFQVSDIKRIPFEQQPFAKMIFTELYKAFEKHMSYIVKLLWSFRKPGSSNWEDVQVWAQKYGKPSQRCSSDKVYTQIEPERDIDHFSYALGIALGRFHPDGSGIANPQVDNLDFALPNGYLFLNGTLPTESLKDSLGHSSCARLHQEWMLRSHKIIAFYNKQYVRTSKANSNPI